MAYCPLQGSCATLADRNSVYGSTVRNVGKRRDTVNPGTNETNDNSAEVMKGRLSCKTEGYPGRHGTLPYA